MSKSRKTDTERKRHEELIKRSVQLRAESSRLLKECTALAKKYAVLKSVLEKMSD
jgi:hypothetical protein